MDLSLGQENNEEEPKKKPKKTEKVKKPTGVQCDVCQKTLKNKYKLKLHTAVHTGEKNFVCKICSKGFQQKWNLMTHTARVHQKEKPFKCKDCGRCFGYSSHFRKHVLKFHFLEKINAPEAVKMRILKPFKCDLCPRSFENQYRLDLHSKRHMGKGGFICGECRKAFVSQEQLAVHLAAAHQRFVCARCGVTFPGAKELEEHLETEHQSSMEEISEDLSIKSTAERKKERLPCEVCGKKITRDSLKKHLNVHFKVRRYPCSFCAKPFLESSQRIVHERIHTGELPYLCDICGKGHTQYGNLRAHRKKHHKLEDPPPDRKRRVKKKEIIVEEKKECTGDETIEEFLQIANNWFKTKFQELKAGKVKIEPMDTPELTEDTMEEPLEERLSDTESEDNLPLASFCTAPSDDNVPLSNLYKFESEILVEKKEDDEETEEKTRQEETRKKINKMIFDRIVADKAMVPFKKDVERVMRKFKRKNGRGGDELRALLTQMALILPDTAIMQRKEKEIHWFCWQCISTFKNRHLLARHLLIHEPEENWPYTCLQCGKRFTQSNNYKEHVLAHDKTCQYYCETCGKGFRHKTHFNTHQLRHKPHIKEEDKKYPCQYCGKKFPSNFHRREHERTHTNEKPFLCKVCGMQFVTSSTLNRHQVAHSNDRPHECNVCEKRFKEKSSLTRHEFTHMGLRFACECGQTFSQRTSLMKHKPICYKREVKPPKPHDCLVCGKRFMTRHDLKRHVETHTSSNCHTCNICNKRLKTPDTYKKHMRRHMLKNQVKKEEHTADSP